VKRPRKSEYRQVETMIRECRPEPRAALLTALVDDVDAHRRRRGAAPRRVMVAALCAGMLAAFAGLGGIGYASSAVKHAAKVTNVAQMVGVSNGSNPTSNSGSETHNPTFDQYRPGKGCGDKNHIHLRENECKKPPK
jgi:ferric-dicitrate binding protein FerR (iron transport regulator)